ncbi:hypothetical protein BC832DRAFT_592675 [Gaertneriomyces semiglobifer]|nr:hypothetical protein BC832DRAFT_592675 [Gaertneriomyces semiglobifer]
MLSGRSTAAPRRKFKPNAEFIASFAAGGEGALKKLIQQSRSTGSLNLSNRHLTAFPDALWDRPSEKQSVNVSFDRQSEDSTTWWEAVELCKLIVADNQLQTLDPRVGAFPALNVLDIHNNNLTELPNEVLASLTNLVMLNLSGNRLSALPASICSLPHLKDLNVSSNCLRQLPPAIGALSLVTLDVSSNDELTTLPPTISNLKQLRSLNVSSTKIASLATLNFNFPNLVELDLSNCQLSQLAFGAESIDWPQLTRLDVRQNKLDGCVPATVASCPMLKELLLSNNKIRNISEQFLRQALRLEVLDAGSNRLDDLPSGLLGLKELKRLDISNNSITKLPPELGLLEGLNVLNYNGNLIRGLPTGPTSRILQFLRDKIVDASPPEIQTLSRASSSGSITLPAGSGIITPSAQERTSRTLDLSQRSLTDLDDSVFEALTFKPSTLILHHNGFTRVPTSLLNVETVTTLILHHCALEAFPEVSLGRLERLDVSSNRIKFLPIGLTESPSLLEINLSHNMITTLPSHLPFPKLQIFIAAGNRLESINPDTFYELSDLSCLDLSDNNIARVPPELGLCQKLKTLALQGNTFKIPRRDILGKGTEAVLEYLRDRVPA